MMDKKWQKRNVAWKDLPAAQRARISVMGIVQLIMSAWTLWDLRKRPATQVRGSKKLWTLLAFVQPVGPIAYLVWGRKKPALA